MSDAREMEVEEVDDEREDGLFEHFTVVADRGQGMLRLDKFLATRLENTSRNRIQAAADAGNILVNGQAAKSSYKVKPLDRISIVLPYPPRELEIVAQDIPLDIVYEDDHLIVVNKEAGMVVHPGHGNYTGTLVNALTFHLRGLPLFEQGDMRAGLVHRIDKNTSGLLVVAKNERAHAFLARQFYDHSIRRIYHALVWGNFDRDEGTIEGNIARSATDRMRMAVYHQGHGVVELVIFRHVWRGGGSGMSRWSSAGSRRGEHIRFGSTWSRSDIRCSTTNDTAATAS